MQYTPRLVVGNQNGKKIDQAIRRETQWGKGLIQALHPPILPIPESRS